MLQQDRVSEMPSPQQIRSIASFTVTGKTRIINGEQRAFLSAATVND